MNIHYFQHVPFETPGYISDWAETRRHSASCTRFFAGDPLPDVENVDFLIVLGGPMNIYEEQKYPWLAEEKRWMKAAFAHGTPILGVCLGAQLLVDCLGGSVHRGDEKEIGWFPIDFAADRQGPFAVFPDRLDVFHWHGDMFEPPLGAQSLARSAGCANQAFAFDNRAVGFQFHLEMADDNIRRVIENGSDELVDGRYIQDKLLMLGQKDKTERNRQLLFQFLDRFTKDL
ncbi:type 1 glutamine amidotransferase [Terrilactibacillus sp. S3-3]|nr:type 1 glutamine amidotransferase [Terrilactibacillus sp. S3-3]